MREFRLINGHGNSYSLMDTKHWLYKPKNLGAKFSSKYEQLGSDFIRTSRITKPDDIKGEVLFTGLDKYKEYSDFIKFIAIEPLTLEYKSDGVYRVAVDLKEIDKSEIEDGILACDLTLKRLSRWYKLVYILNDEEETSGKVYNYTYSYRYSEFEPQQATIESDSGYDSPTRITIFGPAKNPTWRHYLNNELIAEGSVTATIQEGRRIVIDCTTVPYSIKEFDNMEEEKRDLYQFSDFTTKRFFMIQNGRNRISINHELENTLAIAVEARLEYETV